MTVLRRLQLLEGELLRNTRIEIVLSPSIPSHTVYDILMTLVYIALLYQTPAQYNFDWVVKDDYSANDYGHQESRDGYNTQGSYYVQLPDGRLQKVTYHVDGDSGYVAEVTYEGHAQYQAHQPSYHPTPSYHSTPSYHPTPAYRPTPSYRPRPHH
ncbi:cuticle protein 19.8-like [Penaeus chinensis]|uniref:cuticle protein 19.8-like n=1 Tax=Penaeus chinensis TaxID=139456 RepID=UPI001FB6065A|nr:cuticle protein 19.8-like [Penaeus chinensis]